MPGFLPAMRFLGPTGYANIEESRQDLGFEPQVTINEGLPRFVAWYRKYHGV